jgi:hypothetical protein
MELGKMMNMELECRFREFPNWACSFGAYCNLEGLLFPIHDQCQRFRDLVRYRRLGRVFGDHHGIRQSSSLDTDLDILQQARTSDERRFEPILHRGTSASRVD